MKEIHTNLDGTVTYIDNRTFANTKEMQLQYIRERAKELILQVAPEFKQRNAALGILNEQETQFIKNYIINIRNISNEKEIEINAVTWNGDPSTRAAACDQIESVVWE